jgi:glycosyltransferase involved in cell wall biosynthesis
MHKKNVVFTVFHEGIASYIKDFIQSVNKQTNTDFELLILNDGIEDINKYIDILDVHYCVVNVPKNSTIAEVRNYGLELCKDKYENIIFADADDVFADERIELSLKHLEQYEVIINNMCLIDADVQIIKKSLYKELFNKSIQFEDIIDKNYFGLSNTAIKGKFIKEMLPIPPDLKAVDWWIFSIVLYYSKKVFFIDEELTFYRQHQSNIIGSNKNFNLDYVRRALAVKVTHYKSMDLYFTDIKENVIASIYTKKYNCFLIIQERLLANKNFENKYIKYLEDNKPSSEAWWAEILEYNTMEEL